MLILTNKNSYFFNKAKNIKIIMIKLGLIFSIQKFKKKINLNLASFFVNLKFFFWLSELRILLNYVNIN